MWLEHGDSARFDKLKFEPLPEGVVEKRQKFNDYNLWKGFKVTLADGERHLQQIGRDQCMQQLRPFLEHIMHVWCRGEVMLYTYVLNWMAWCIQKPHEKTKVAIAIRGDKGSGKGVIIQMLGKIYGKEYFFHAQKAEDLVGNFNDHLQTCLLCFVDEVTFATDKAATNILKTIISEETVNVNTKFKSRFVLDSFMNLFLAGNLPKIVECEGKERKFLVLETNDKWGGSQTQQSAQYFRRLTSTPPQMLRFFFSRRDISLFNPLDVPSSKAMRDQKALSFPLVHSWLQRCLGRGRILDYVPANQLPMKSAGNVDVSKMTDAEQLAAEWEMPIVKDHIYPAFSQYCKELGRKTTSDTVFWKDLHKVFRPEGSKESMLVCHRTRTKQQVEGHAAGSNISLQKQVMTLG